jgi:pectate lyase
MKQIKLSIFFTLLCLLGGFASQAQDGYAMINGATTGGAGGQTVTVSNATDLISYATSSSPYIIKVSGTITLTNRLDMAANKTIEGVNTSSTINGNISIGVNNVIIRYITFTNPSGYGLGDGISIWGGTHVYVDHVTFVDCADGSCDINHLADYVTVSNCKFYYVNQVDHRFAMILGGDPYDAPGNNLRVSLHHNWFGAKCDQRMPSGSYSNAHVYNNFFNSAGNYYSTNARVGTHWLVQNNYYDGVNNPCNYQDGGIMQISGNIYNNCTGSQFTASNGTVTVPYSYSLTATSSVPSSVQSNAGNIGLPTSVSAFSTIQAESYSSMSGVQTETCSEGGLNVGYINSGDWIRISGVNFGSGANSFTARVASNSAGGTITLRIDGTSGTQIGTCAVSSTGGWQTWANASGSTSGVSGTHDLYLMFSGASGYLFNLNHFVFIAGSGNYVRLQNRGTGLYLDGMGRTVNGDACGQYGNTSHVNAQWELIDAGSGYKQLRNVGTGLYLDGMGLTANGSECGQYANTTHINSHWSVQQYSGVYYRIQNRGTGLFIDGMGRTANGDAAGQYANTSHVNAQWQMITVSGSRQAEAEVELSENFKLFPNPTVDFLNIDLGQELSADAGIVIFDNAGKQVLAMKLLSSKSTIDVSNFKSGIYFIKSTNNNKILTTKFLKK